MPRVRYIHRDDMLLMLGCMPARKVGETDKAFEARKGAAATKSANDYGLIAHTVEGKRARRYREDEVTAAQKKVVTPIAA